MLDDLAEELLALPDDMHLAELTPGETLALQRGLAIECVSPGPLDGIPGKKTQEAWGSYACAPVTTLDALAGMAESLRLKNSVTSAGAADLPATIRSMSRYFGLDMPEQFAYIMATASWETGGLRIPVEEAFWLSQSYRDKLRYAPFYGRGYVQLTHRNNYEKYEKLLNLPLVVQPDLALDPTISLFILVHGFVSGTFTRHRIQDYIYRKGDAPHIDMHGARRCINGWDRAGEIATMAQKWVVWFDENAPAEQRANAT